MDEIKKEWYVVNTYAGHENRVKDNLERRAESIMTDDAWYVVRNTPGVTGFIGSSGGGAKPFPVAADEIESILQRMGMSERKLVVNFQVGDRVKILRGPFKDIEGTIDEMNDDAQSATVLTILFGRETPTEIGYGDLEKVDQ